MEPLVFPKFSDSTSLIRAVPFPRLITDTCDVGFTQEREYKRLKLKPLFFKRRFLVGPFRAQNSETKNDINSANVKEAPNISSSSQTEEGAKNHIKSDKVVFVAGATGKVGSRTVRELLKMGYYVRAGTRAAKNAEALLKSLEQLKPNLLGADPSVSSSFNVKENIEIVECDLEKPDRIRKALNKAQVVVCCIGASEKEVSDITGPFRIDYKATKNLIDAATVGKIQHFILVTSLGTSKIGFPAALLNLFWGVLVWKRKAEEALIRSGLTYTIVRPGGMERPTDSYKETHNLVLASADTYFGGQVSNLQVAELIACMVCNGEYCKNKIVEVIAETTAPRLPIEKLLMELK